jgi:hypothetical protein
MLTDATYFIKQIFKEEFQMNDNSQTKWDSFRDATNARIKEIMTRTTLAEHLQEQNEKAVTRKHGWIEEFRAEKGTYIFMAVSALFTAMLGLILGLAPALVTNADGSTMIEFHTDLLHVGIALIYASAFVMVTEVAFILGKNKFHAREEGNLPQQASMITMMALAFLSIVGTGWAGATIAASVLGFLKDFQQIPDWAQNWVVRILSVLFAFYAVLLTVYRLASQEAKNKRLMDNTARKLREDHALRMTMVEIDEEEQLNLAEIQAYREAVASGRLTAADALAARRAKKTLKQLEAEQKRDLNGDGIIEQLAPLGFSDNHKSKSNFQ